VTDIAKAVDGGTEVVGRLLVRSEVHRKGARECFHGRRDRADRVLVAVDVNLYQVRRNLE